VLLLNFAFDGQLEGTVNRIVNKVIKERPDDPLSVIAQMLLS